MAGQYEVMQRYFFNVCPRRFYLTISSSSGKFGMIFFFLSVCQYFCVFVCVAVYDVCSDTIALTIRTITTELVRCGFSGKQDALRFIV